MWRADRGYRIGRTTAMRTDGRGRHQSGLKIRMNQEHGDKLWILWMGDTIGEAAYWESLFAAVYGLPTACFHAKGRDRDMDDTLLARLYREVDTVTAAKELMADELIHPEFPHYTPQNGERRQTLNLTMFSDRRRATAPYHRIQWSTNQPQVAQRLVDAGYEVRGLGGSRVGYRFETSRKDYRDAVSLARSVAEAAGLDVRRRMQIEGRTYDYTPLSHLRPGMRVLVCPERSGTSEESGAGPALEECALDEVTFGEYAGEVYDLEVDVLHTYVANQVLVHNSVYAFRGADMRNILEFEEAFAHGHDHHARAELPLDPDHPRRRQRGDRQQPDPPAQAAVHRGRGR